MKYPQIFRRILPYRTFLLVPQGLPNCQLSTVNCQLKDNLSYHSMIPGRPYGATIIDPPRTHCPRRLAAEITPGQLRRSVVAGGYFMEQ